MGTGASSVPLAYCLVTMALVPLLALVAGNYLALTHQYAVAIGLTGLGFGSGYGDYQRQINNEPCIVETA